MQTEELTSTIKNGNWAALSRFKGTFPGVKCKLKMFPDGWRGDAELADEFTELAGGGAIVIGFEPGLPIRAVQQHNAQLSRFTRVAEEWLTPPLLGVQATWCRSDSNPALGLVIASVPRQQLPASMEVRSDCGQAVAVTTTYVMSITTGHPEYPFPMNPPVREKPKITRESLQRVSPEAITLVAKSVVRGVTSADLDSACAALSLEALLDDVLPRTCVVIKSPDDNRLVQLGPGDWVRLSSEPPAKILHERIELSIPTASEVERMRLLETAPREIALKNVRSGTLSGAIEADGQVDAAALRNLRYWLDQDVPAAYEAVESSKRSGTWRYAAVPVALAAGMLASWAVPITPVTIALGFGLLGIALGAGASWLHRRKVGLLAIFAASTAVAFIPLFGLAFAIVRDDIKLGESGRLHQLGEPFLLGLGGLAGAEFDYHLDGAALIVEHLELLLAGLGIVGAVASGLARASEIVAQARGGSQTPPA